MCLPCNFILIINYIYFWNTKFVSVLNVNVSLFIIEEALQNDLLNLLMYTQFEHIKPFKVLKRLFNIIYGIQNNHNYITN